MIFWSVELVENEKKKNSILKRKKYNPYQICLIKMVYMLKLYNSAMLQSFFCLFRISLLLLKFNIWLILPTPYLVRASCFLAARIFKPFNYTFKLRKFNHNYK